MKKYTGTTLVIFIILMSFKLTLNAQIQDIKKNSNENKNNNSNNNSSGNNSSNSDDIGSEIASGCFSSLFEMFAGCLFSGHNNTDDDNNFVTNNPDDFVNNNLYQEPDTNNIIENQNIIPTDSAIIPYKNPENNENIDDQTGINNENQKLNINKKPTEFSLDLNANFAMGFETSKEKTYTYYDFLPGARANLAWFAIDYRYNMLTEFSQDLPDAFKTWDLLFLFNLKSSENAKFSFGAGIHNEEFSKTNFFELYMGAKIGLSQNRDYLDMDGRVAFDSNNGNSLDESVSPFTEVGIGYNKRFINSNNFNGYISIGAIYQNYYSSTDIWAFKAGVIFNWHK